MAIIEKQTGTSAQSLELLIGYAQGQAELPNIIIGIKLNDRIEVIRFRAQAAAA